MKGERDVQRNRGGNLHMLSTLLLPRGFNKVSTRIQEVRVAKGISSKSSALDKASNLIQGQCVNYYMEERIICPAIFSTHRSGFPLRLSHRLTGGDSCEGGPAENLSMLVKYLRTSIKGRKY